MDMELIDRAYVMQLPDRDLYGVQTQDGMEWFIKIGFISLGDAKRSLEDYRGVNRRIVRLSRYYPFPAIEILSFKKKEH